MLRKPLFIVDGRVKVFFKTYTGVQKTKRLSSKSGRGTRNTRLHKHEISSLSADKINELLLYNKK